MRWYFVVTCLLLTTGCLQNSPVAPMPLDREIVVARGRTVDLSNGVSVSFIGVLGDSRCPIDAVCIQGGDAVVRIAITAAGSRAERDLHTGPLNPVSHAGVQVRLVDLHPYPFSSRQTEQDEYRATLHVTR
jgi:hypothetical protein